MLDLSLIDFEDNEVLDYYTNIIYLKIPSSYKKRIPNNLNTVVYFEMPYNIIVDYIIPNNVLYLYLPGEYEANIYNLPKNLLFCGYMEYSEYGNIDIFYCPYIVYIDAFSIEFTESFKNLMYIHILCIDMYDNGITIKNQYIQYICLLNSPNVHCPININVNYLNCLDGIATRLDNIIKQSDKPILMRTIEHIYLSRKANIKIEYI